MKRQIPLAVLLIAAIVLSGCQQPPIDGNGGIAPDGTNNEKELCGNDTVDAGENCSNCPADVKCVVEEECIGGVCKAISDGGPSNGLESTAKWYSAGNEITGLGGENGPYKLVIGDITASGIGEYEIALDLYKDGLAVNSDSLEAGSSTTFDLLDNTIRVLEIKKFETGPEPLAVLIEIK